MPSLPLAVRNSKGKTSPAVEQRGLVDEGRLEERLLVLFVTHFGPCARPARMSRPRMGRRKEDADGRTLESVLFSANSPCVQITKKRLQSGRRVTLLAAAVGDGPFAAKYAATRIRVSAIEDCGFLRPHIAPGLVTVASKSPFRGYTRRLIDIVCIPSLLVVGLCQPAASRSDQHQSTTLAALRKSKRPR